MARITCGTNGTEGARWDGKTITQIRTELGDFLNIPQGATVLLNGNRVTDENIVLRADDELEFVKQSGEKGKLFELGHKLAA